MTVWQMNVEAVTTEISIHFEDKQVKTISGLIESVTVFNEVDKFSIYRPSVTIKQNPKAWWRYTQSLFQTLILTLLVSLS
jgi:hypothetical protein